MEVTILQQALPEDLLDLTCCTYAYLAYTEPFDEDFFDEETL